MILFRATIERTEADQLIDLLSEHGINARISENSGNLDYVFQGETTTHKFEVLINEPDREKAEQLLKELATEVLDTINKDHYLFLFSNEELINVLINKDEWNEIDVLLSRQILKERGVKIDQADIDKKQFKRKLELEKPEGGQIGWIIVGYLLVLFGGFAGIILGSALWLSRKTLPNGTKVPVYSEQVRKHGKIIFYIGVIVFTVFFLYRIGQMIVFFN